MTFKLNMIPVKSKTAITNNPLHFSFPIKDIENIIYAVKWKRNYAGYQNKSTEQFTHLAMQTLQGQQQWRGDRGPPFFRESRLDIFFTINVFLCDVKKKNLANLDKYDSENGVCMCVCACVCAQVRKRES